MTRPATAPAGPHRHDEHTDHGHRHSHGLVDPSIRRSREGLRVVGISLAVLALTALAQAAIYVATNSVALLADLIHNAGDALTAVPFAAAFLLRSERAENGAGIAVVLTILASAIAVALGVPIADPIIGLLITALILRITVESWNTVRGHGHH
jgi:divalent metal cation (Fe/Co/Zn/Cd) transporter